MKECDLQTKFSRWLRHHVQFPIAYELKITHTNTLLFSRLMEHQKDALLKTKHSTLCYKIPDTGYDRKPFDGFCLNRCTSVVGVMFYKRNIKTLYLIDIEDFLKESEDHKSLTQARAKEISWRVVELA
jgi:hypothetical protein